MTITYTAAFLGGLVTIVAPCSALLLPSFFAYAFTSRRTLLARTGIFFLGLLCALLPLGGLAGAAGLALLRHSGALILGGGIVIVILGLWQALALPTPHPSRWIQSAVTHLRSHLGKRAGQGPHLGTRLVRGKRTREPGSALAVFFLGLSYGLAGAGCTGPILGAVLTAAGLGGSIIGGAILLFFYALGVFAPVLILALIWDLADISGRKWLRPRPLKLLGRQTTWGNLISGLVCLILGSVLVFAGGSLGQGGLDATTQSRLEQALITAVAAIPNWIFIGLVIVIAALLSILTYRNRRHQRRHQGS